MLIIKKLTNKLEGIGLILVLFSFFIQMIETNVENDIKEQEHYHIHKCLDYLWAVVADDYANKHPKEGISTLIEFKNYFRNYKIYSEDYNDLNNWVNIVHSKWITLTRIILFITGSILLIIPKFTKEKR